MSEAKNEAEVGKETAFDEKFMMEKMSSIEGCCKKIEESLSSISFTIAVISQKIPPMSPMMGGINPFGSVGMNPMIGYSRVPPFFSNEEFNKRYSELLEAVSKQNGKMENLEKHAEAIDSKRIRDKLKAIDDENATLLPREDGTYVLNALNRILLTGVEVARILDKYNLPITDVDDPEKRGYARNKLMNVVAEINKIGSRW